MARRQITPSLARSVARWRPMCDRWRVNRARAGDKYSARTSMVRQRMAATRSQSVGDGASTAHVGAKYFSPVHPWCGGVLRARDHNVWLIAHQPRTYGRKIFRPYIRGAAADGGRATTMCGRWRINRARRGEKYFARTSLVRRRVAGAQSQRLGDCASIAHVRAKNISPLHMRCVVTLGGCHDLGCGDV